ncbi:MAG: ATP-binding protein [Actinomycetota bacterium]
MTSPASGQARKTVSVLFCDLIGSTALGEQLDPETLREVIQRYFHDMRAVIERHGGTVEKFIGDAVMAVFGVPVVREDDALRAVRAAADMQSTLAESNVAFERDFGTRIEARIGVHTGEVIAGDPSTGESFVSGDAVNVAARLEQAAEPGEILVGETTYQLVRAAVIAEPMPPMTLKGKADPFAAYRLVVVEPGAEMLPRRLDAPLVGRDRELRALTDAFDAAAATSQVQLFTVIGEAGLGKSRLALELVNAVTGKGRVLRGRCLPYGEGITFWPINEILEAAAGVQGTESVDEACSLVERLLPPDQADLGRRLAGMLGGGAAPGPIQETFLAVRRWLEHLASDGPVVVVFDDIQWGEEAFLDLVQYLATFVASSRLLVVCLARPELLDVRPDWSRVGATIRLEPLEAGSSTAMIANLLGREGMPEELATTIVHAAAGNPLFIEEMLRMLVDHGVVERKDGRWVVTGDLQAVGAPATVHAVIAARLDRLDPAERSALQVASVVGEVFWWGAVADLSEGATSGETGRHLQALVRKDLIRPDAGAAFTDDAFRFGHLLIRDVAYESLPKRSRASLHERFALWVDERAGERTAEYDEIVGYHAEMAHRYLAELAPSDERVFALAAAASGRLAAAGERAFTRGDAAAARNLLSRAVALMPPTEPRRIELLMLLATALGEGGRLMESVATFDHAIDGARALADERLELLATVRRIHFYMLSHTEVVHEDAMREAERVLPFFERTGDDIGLAETFRVMGAIHIWAGRCAEAIVVLGRAAEHAHRGGDLRLERGSQQWAFLAITEGPAPIDEGIRRIRGALAGHEDDRLFAMHAGRYLAQLEAMTGRGDEAERWCEEAITTARDLGMQVSLGGGILRAAAVVAVLAGDLGRAERYLREAVEILVEAKDWGHLTSVAPDLALVLLSTEGREDEAFEAIELGWPTMIDDDVDAQVRARAAKAIYLGRTGDIGGAERLARDAVRRASATDYANLHVFAAEALAEVLDRGGRHDEAGAELERAIDLHRAKGNVVSVEADRRLLAYRRAAAAGKDR